MAEDGKVLAIISYITWIGLVLAIVLNMEKKNEFARFHIRQSLLLNLVFLVSWVPIVGWLLAILAFVAWIIGIINAIQGKATEVFLFGKYAQQWFKSL